MINSADSVISSIDAAIKNNYWWKSCERTIESLKEVLTQSVENIQSVSFVSHQWIITVSKNDWTFENITIDDPEYYYNLQYL